MHILVTWGHNMVLQMHNCDAQKAWITYFTRMVMSISMQLSPKAQNSRKKTCASPIPPYLSLEEGGSELVLNNLDRVSSMELKGCTIETWDEEDRILVICGHNLVLEYEMFERHQQKHLTHSGLRCKICSTYLNHQQFFFPEIKKKISKTNHRKSLTNPIVIHLTFHNYNTLALFIFLEHCNHLKWYTSNIWCLNTLKNVIKYLGYLRMFEDHGQVSRSFTNIVPYGFVCSQLEELHHCLLSAILHCYRQSLKTFALIIAEQF